MLVGLLLLLLPPGGSTAAISCYNDQGEAVDWFYLYKLPKQHGTKSPGDGLRYLLMEKGSEGWTEGKVLMNDSSGAAGRTVGQVYSLGQNADAAYVLYNDQPPLDRNRGGNEYGHTKGVVLLGAQRGFWLVHSTPHFPAAPPAGRYGYPDSGRNNGQSFLCISFPLERFQSIGEQLLINQPLVYACSVPESLAAVVPALAELCRRRAGSGPMGAAVKVPSNRSVTLTSSDGSRFVSFAKGASFNHDLYHWWVAPSLRSDLLVQFWVRSRGVLPSDCSRGWKVLDIKVIAPGQTFTFNTSQDHSKWAVSPGPGGQGGGWVCVGDINRNKAEEQRGGGTVCLQEPPVWKAYRTAALQCQACGGAATTCPPSRPPPGGRWWS